MTSAGNQVKEGLRKRIIQRQASLTVEEKAFLSALLLDEPGKAIVSPGKSDEARDNAARVLDNDTLFSVPDNPDVLDKAEPPKARRSIANHIKLWKVHEGAIKPSSFLERHEKIEEKRRKSLIQPEPAPETEEEEEEEEDTDAPSVKSDEEVRKVPEEASETSSWDVEEGGFEHYDAWDVLKDEYAGDFGFDYSERPGFDPDDDDDDGRDVFMILGTSANDKSAQPHVLSPPLMESLLNFVPETLRGQNFWLKFSLVRDGASLDTLKQYARASPVTIMAIETTTGDVFGSFTSSSWHTDSNYFGSGEAFLWRMRHNRLSTCHSLYEQAKMESEVDFFPYSGLNRFIQLCTYDKIAVGGGELDTSGSKPLIPEDSQPADGDLFPEEEKHVGFGIAIDEGLLRGTSTPCATFRNPSLVTHSDSKEVFEIVNLEMWTFTPCYDLDSAEKLEMTKFFVSESMHSKSMMSSSSVSTSGSDRLFSSRDLVQGEFYARVGEGKQEENYSDPSDYVNMIGTMTSSPRL